MAAIESCLESACLWLIDLFSTRKSKLLDQWESCVFANMQLAAHPKGCCPEWTEHFHNMKKQCGIWRGWGCFKRATRALPEKACLCVLKSP